jgi:hypothetical protein
MAYDPTTRQLVLFGGVVSSVPSEVSAATWIWSGSSWKTQTPATSPPARAAASLAFAPSANELVLFGGYAASSRAFADTWMWAGSTWVLHRYRSSPSARITSSMTPDGSGQLILFGGAIGNASLGDTWRMG